MQIKSVALGALLFGAGTMAFRSPASEGPQPSKAVSSITDIRTDSAAAAQSSDMFASIQALRRAEDAYFAAHGRYTADRHELEGYTPVAGADVFVTAGPDWFVVRGEIRGMTVQQLTVWRADRAPVTSGAFSDD